VVEVGLITPPVGMNLFIINSMSPETRLSHTYRGVLPFVASDIVRTAILVAFPPITLWLVWMLY
jgi:C4-dicarboxylate transporter DctM subunit